MSTVVGLVKTGLLHTAYSVKYGDKWCERVGETKNLPTPNDENRFGQLMINGKHVETVEFCYMGNILTNYENCHRESQATVAKANSAFNSLNNIW